MGRRSALPLAPPAPPRRTPPASPEEGTSYQSLQPTCCQRVPTGSFHSRTLGSRRPDHRFRRCSARPHAHTVISSAACTTAPDSRKRHLRPRVVAQLLLRSPAATHHPLCPPGPPAPLGPGVTYAQPVWPLASRESWSLTLLSRHLLKPAREPTRLGNAKDPFHERRANAAACQARSAFRRRIPLNRGSCWRLSRDLEGRHWCFGLAASAQLPTRLHAQALRARPLHLPALTGAPEPRAVRRLLQFP
jgi:hypothetical protein